MNKLPVKFRLAQAIFENKEISNRALYELLKTEYPRDRSITEPGVDDLLLSLKAVGLIQLTHAALDAGGKLVQCFQITDYGIRRMRYLV